MPGCDCCEAWEGKLVPDSYQWWSEGELLECCRGEIVKKTEGTYRTTTEFTSTFSSSSVASDYDVLNKDVQEFEHDKLSSTVYDGKFHGYIPSSVFG